MKRFLAFLNRLFGQILELQVDLNHWFDVIPLGKIIEYIQRAEEFTNMNANEKREMVFGMISEYAVSRGVVIPKSVIYWLLETAFQQYLKTRVAPRVTI